MTAATPMAWIPTCLQVAEDPPVGPAGVDHLAGEHARQQRPDRSAHAVHAEGVQGVVVAERSLDDGDGDVAHDGHRRCRSRSTPIGVTNPAAGVMATRPATAPVAAPSTVGLRVTIQSMTIHARAAMAVAVFVLMNALTASSFAASALPALNPNHPNQSSAAPISV